MLSQLLMLMPYGLLERSPQWAVAGAAVGVVLWAAGGVFSRYLTTLVAVAIGTSIGMRLPSWLGWQIDGMGTGVAGALLLGLSGYLLHRTWIGLWLATILVLWSGIGVWLAVGHGMSLSIPQWHDNLHDTLTALFQQMPPPLNPRLPLAWAAAMTASVVLTAFCPRFSKCLTYSLLGTTLGAVTALIAARNMQPDWFAAVAPPIGGLMAALLGIVAIGVASQWWLLPESPPVERQKGDRADNENRSGAMAPAISSAPAVNS